MAVHEALAKANFERDVAMLTDSIAARLQLIVHSRDYPILDVTVEHTKAVRFRLRGDNFDELPPAIAILKPDGQPWTGPLPGGVFNAGPHSSQGGPFICMRGAREYHTHSSHVNDRWENYRGQDGMGIVGILMQLAGVWRRDVK
ncbi:MULTISPECIES: putative metal-binding protein [unclassified Bradyrhizobium]|uniref:putative metal-binding protein n=1 Tax=unclassified Bradyrhizobium TaxID=2631580 RepID=UPI0029165645|nr:MULTISPECIES: putative metal-binding protein [unclassified Bradyrhizobium]